MNPTAQLNKFRFGVITRNTEVLKMVAIVEKTAPYDLPVLITGETGTGKELIARAVHECGPRGKKHFYAINCSAIPSSLLESEFFGHTRNAFTGAGDGRKGLFEAAAGSSLFLDEIGAIPVEMQTKLLRTLQEGTARQIGSNNEMETNVRILSATAEILEEKMLSGDFRRDLYYRLNAVQIHLPPLRERKEDISLLCGYFLEKLSRSMGRKLSLSEEAGKLFADYAWPGNIREMKNILERTAILSRTEVIHPEDLPEQLLSGDAEKDPDQTGLDYKQQFQPIQDRFDRQIVSKALRLTGGSVFQAAKRLNISLRNLQYKIKRLKLG